MINAFLAPVPTPETNIIKNPSQIQVHFAGSHLELMCSVTLTSAVDLPVMVHEQWLKDGYVITETSRVLIHPPVPTRTHHYQAVLEFSTLSKDVDSGEYKCHVTVTAETLPNTTRIIKSSDESRTNITVSIQGMMSSYFLYEHR